MKREGLRHLRCETCVTVAHLAAHSALAEACTGTCALSSPSRWLAGGHAVGRKKTVGTGESNTSETAPCDVHQVFTLPAIYGQLSRSLL